MKHAQHAATREGPDARTRAALAALLAAVLVAGGLLVSCTTGDAEDEGSTATEAAEEADAGSGEEAADGDAEAEEEEEEPASFVAHGSEYGKSETVIASTTLDGELSAVSVSEWIKNPEGLESIEDVSSLQSITCDDEEIDCTQDGESLTWQTGGEDVSYTGISDQELPFAISYSYKLDGEEIDPDELQDVSGELEVTISYENLSSETVTVDGVETEVQQPYALASLVIFDTQHAKDIEVDGGQISEMDGYTIAIGMGMPGLAETLGLEDYLELPESVTITAEVCGFDMPDITTIATNQTLSMIDEDSMDGVDDSLDEAFGQLGSVTEALDELSTGIAAIDEAIATINEGQAALNEAFPNATDGITALQTAAGGIGTALDASDEALTASLAVQADALAQLQSIDTSEMTPEQQAAIATAIADLTASTQADAGAQAGVQGANEVAAQLDEGLGSVVEGLETIQSGYEQLEEGTATVNEATTALATATDTMSASVAEALDEAEIELADELELVQAVADLAEGTGAWCGSAEDMPATTTFIVTAEAAEED